MDPAIQKSQSPKDEAGKKDFAKQFEAIFINKLLDQMTKSINEINPDKDPSSKQVNSIFNMFLSRHVSQNGGMGMWKDIYHSLSNVEKGQDGGSVNSQI